MDFDNNLSPVEPQADHLLLVGTVEIRSVGSLYTRVFETRTATGSELFSLLTCLSHNHICIAKYLFSIRDD